MLKHLLNEKKKVIIYTKGKISLRKATYFKFGIALKPVHRYKTEDKEV